MPLTVGEVWEMIADLNDKTPVVLLLPGAGEDEWEEVDIDIQVDVGSLLNTAVIITGSRSIEAVGVTMIPEKVERVARFLRERLRDCGAEVPDQRDMERTVEALCEQPWVVLAVGQPSDGGQVDA